MHGQVTRYFMYKTRFV